MKKILLAFAFIICLFGCKKATDTTTSTPIPTTVEPYYYPPLTGYTWETKTAASLGWDDALLNQALDYAGTKNSYGIVILQHGKIVKERYWNGWTIQTPYYIASAGKSVVAFLTGIAQQEGSLSINDKVSQYLGTGWTSLPLAKENLITIKNQLSMTTGLDDAVPDQDCTTPSCLIYKADAGTRWAYHNAPYHLLQTVVGNANNQTFQQYSKSRLFNKIGMPNAFWFNYIMYCTTREASRFGSLILTKGKWNGTALLNDDAYFTTMTNTTQPYNLSYGYLWWLNGKASCMVPQSQITFNTALVPAAPADMIMALGKDDKKIYVIPSLDVVIVRLGDNAAGTTALGPSSFDNEFWTRLKPALHY